MSLTWEAASQEFANALLGERALRWSAGDVVCEVIKANAGRKDRAKVFGAFAQLGNCSIRYVQQLAEVSAAFAATHRYPDIHWSRYLAALRAAKRVDRKPEDVLQEAVTRGWHVRELRAVGNNGAVRSATFDGQCAGCGVVVKVRGAIGLQGTALRCPACPSLLEGETELGRLA